MNIVFVCMIFMFATGILAVAGCAFLHDDWIKYKKNKENVDESQFSEVKSNFHEEIKNDFIFIGINVGLFIAFFSGYFFPTRYYKNTIKPIIKNEYGNVYEYEYSVILNNGSFLYNNEKYNITVINDIDNNKYVQITKKNNEEHNNEDILNLPLIK